MLLARARGGGFATDRQGREWCWSGAFSGPIAVDVLTTVRPERHKGVETLMLGKEEVEAILNQFRREGGSDPNWEQLLRDLYLGIARADGGVALGNLDPRVVSIIQQH